MKLLLICVLSLFSIVGFSQSPNSFKYQSVLLDKSGILIINKPVSVRVSILQSSINGTTIYSETHSPTTSSTGIINLEIGNGTVVQGSFSTIDWEHSPYFVKIEIDPTGGSTFELVGVSQLLSVPYALFSQTSGDEKWDSVTNGINFKGGDVGIGTSTPAYTLDVAGTVNATSLLMNGTSVVSSPWSLSGGNVSYSSGNVGIGTSTPSANIEIEGSGSSNPFLLTTKNNSSNSISIYSAGDIDYLQASTALFRSRGTNQSPTSLQTGDRIGLFTANGYANGGYNTQATIEMYAGNSLGSYMKFETTPNPMTTRLERMRITENGNIGIGTSTPAYTLDVAGTVNATSLLVNGAPVGSSPWSLSGGNVSYSSGNVGIGTSTPSANIEIEGSGSSNPFLLTTKNNSSNSISIYSAGDIDYLQASTALFRSRGTNQSPTSLQTGDRIGLFTANGYANGGYNTQATIEMYAGNSLGSYMKFETTPNPMTTRLERMRITENGNIGIGTSTPAYTLDVAGTVNATSLLVNGAPVGSSPWSLSGGNVSYSSGNVGIGTSTPSASLEIDGPGTSNSFLITTKNNSSNAMAFYSAGNIDYLQSSIGMFRARGTYQSPTSILAGDRIGSYGSFGYTSDAAYDTGAAMEMYAGNSLGTYLIFGTTATPGATRTERMRITESGNVTVQTGDVFINNPSSGIIMKSPNGTCFRMTVNDAGAPVFTSVACPQ